MKTTDMIGANMLGDKAYGTKEIIAHIKEHGATVVIPSKSNAKEPREADYYLYKERHLVERFFQKANASAASPQDTISSTSLSSRSCIWRLS